LSFDVWLDPNVSSELREPNGLRKELEQLYMYVAFLPLLASGDLGWWLINYSVRPSLDSRRKTPAGKRGNTDERDALIRVQARSLLLAL
jgi:hypothetical protein